MDIYTIALHVDDSEWIKLYAIEVDIEKES